jgi:general secretion pathway protein N
LNSALFGAPTQSQAAWQRTQRKVSRWGAAGLVCGAVLGGLAFAPAAWVARAVSSASAERMQLADARGTVWSGSAVPVLTGGAGSSDAAALPGRLSWTIGWQGSGLAVRARQPCCLNGDLTLRVAPGLGRWRVEMIGNPDAKAIGQWPAAWLVGLGTPWNTLQPGGTLRLVSPGLVMDNAEGRWRMSGRLDVELAGTSSRVSTLPILGSYRLSLVGDAAGAAQLQLTTLEGLLQLAGSGQWAASSFRFRGEARAAEGAEAALDNLLNIIGRRQGARAVISIG